VRAVPGLRVPGAWDGFELCVRAILGQQISVARASTLAGELVRAWGVPLREPSGSLTHLFPDPATVADAGGETVARRLGMPRARGHAIATLAAALAGGAVSLETPYPELVPRLVELPGIGPWTAEYIAMRLGHGDAFPAGDLWLRRALDLDERALGKRAERWRPYRAYAALHLWVAPPPARA
jgi:3-methyladenine DNA glycosylase/8-oxoguanine DNA glycosylase